MGEPSGLLDGCIRCPPGLGAALPVAIDGGPMHRAASTHRAAWMAPTHSAQGVVKGDAVDPAGEQLNRVQWDANWGYCGETSFIAAGMNFGQYASQFTVRGLASPGIPQSQAASQLLLGVNDQAAARAMHLKVSQYSDAGGTRGSSRAARFISWMRDRMTKGARVILGVYAKGSHDTEYDHIVPAVDIVAGGIDSGGTSGVEGGVASGDQSGPGDGFSFADNAGHVLTVTFSNLLRDRRGANAASAPSYSIPTDANNYAAAVEGVADREGVTIPVMLQASRRSEPEMVDGGLLPPAPKPLAIRATVYIPNQNQSYKLYRYNNFSKVPEASFNAAASNAVQSWLIPAHSGSSVFFDINVLTSDTVVFRAVPSTAP